MDKAQTIQQILATFAWEKGTFRNYYFNCTYDGRQLNGCFECEFNQLDQFDTEALTRLKNKLAELDSRAHIHIQSQFPDDDAQELELNDLVLLPAGAFKLGYYTGRTPYGETYLYVNFDQNFAVQNEISYETY